METHNSLEALLTALLVGNNRDIGYNNRYNNGYNSDTTAIIETINRSASQAAATATETRADINRISGDVILAGAQSETRTTSAVERNGGDTRTRLEAVAGELRSVIGNESRELHSTIEDRAAELRGTMQTQFATTLLEIERGKFETIKAKCDLEKQAAENAAAIQLEACKNQHELSKQLAECCCEIKSALHVEGEETRGLIRQNELDNLRQRLTVTENALAEERERCGNERRGRDSDNITRIVNVLSQNSNNRS